jgi:hypothetical protein
MDRKKCNADIVEMAEREMKSAGKNKRAVPIFQKY